MSANLMARTSLQAGNHVGIKMALGWYMGGRSDRKKRYNG
jgi:hypothetical protein